MPFSVFFYTSLAPKEDSYRFDCRGAFIPFRLSRFDSHWTIKTMITMVTMVTMVTMLTMLTMVMIIILRNQETSYPNQETSRVRTNDLSLVFTASINGSHRACRSHVTSTLTQMTWQKGNTGGRRPDLMQPQTSSSLTRWWPNFIIRVVSHGWVSGWMLQPTALLVFWSYVNSLPLLKSTWPSRLEHQLRMM